MTPCTWPRMTSFRAKPEEKQSSGVSSVIPLPRPLFAITEFLKFDDSSSLVGWIPHFHDMGLISQIMCFYAGMNVVIMSPLAFLKRPVRLLQAISKYRATATAAPNFAYDLIARRVP